MRTTLAHGRQVHRLVTDRLDLIDTARSAAKPDGTVSPRE